MYVFPSWAYSVRQSRPREPSFSFLCICRKGLCLRFARGMWLRIRCPHDPRGCRGGSYRFPCQSDRRLIYLTLLLSQPTSLYPGPNSKDSTATYPLLQDVHVGYLTCWARMCPLSSHHLVDKLLRAPRRQRQLYLRQGRRSFRYEP